MTRRGLLAARSVRPVLAALVASAWADGFLPLAMSFAVLRVTGSIAQLGLVLAVQSGVALTLTLVGGLAGDRFPRRRIMIVSLAVRLTVAAATAAALLTGTASFALLLVAAAVYGCADGFFGPASSALLPEIVPREQLAPANALIGGTASAGSVIAPAVAGLVVATLGPGATFALQTAILATALGCLVAVRIPATRPAEATRPAHAIPPAHDASRPTIGRQLGTGWSEFAQRRWLWLPTLEWTVFSLVILAPV